MTTSKEIAGIEKRIGELESAYASMKAQVAQAVAPGDKERWQEAVDSTDEERKYLRKLIQDGINAEKHGGDGKPLLKKVLDTLEDAEKVAFRTFVLGTTIIGAGTLLSHEITPLVNLIEQGTSTQQQEEKDAHTKRSLSLGSGNELIPESLRKMQQEHNARFKELIGSSGELSTSTSLHETAHEWLRLDKISEPDSITNFIEVLKLTPTKSCIKIGAPQTLMPPDRKES
jgi:hypothetical protein